MELKNNKSFLRAYINIYLVHKRRASFICVQVFSFIFLYSLFYCHSIFFEMNSVMCFFVRSFLLFIKSSIDVGKNDDYILACERRYLSWLALVFSRRQRKRKRKSIREKETGENENLEKINEIIGKMQTTKKKWNGLKKNMQER